MHLGVRKSAPPKPRPLSSLISNPLFINGSSPRSFSEPVAVPQAQQKDEANHLPFVEGICAEVLQVLKYDETFIREVVAQMQQKVDRRVSTRLLLGKDSRKHILKVIDDLQRFMDKQLYLEKVIKTQSYIRRWLAFRKLKSGECKLDLKASKALGQRHKIFEYHRLFRILIKQERDYASSLNLVVTAYMTGFKRMAQEHKGVIEPQDIASVFWNIEKLHQMHTQVLKDLEEIRALRWPFLTGLADLFLKLVPQLNSYEDYLSNLKTAQDALNRLKKKQKCAAFLDETAVKFKNNLILNDLLLLPKNQISFYEQILEDLLNSTPFPGAAEAHKLTAAFAIIKETYKLVTESGIRSENRAFLTKIQRSIHGHPGPLNLVSKIFVRNADIRVLAKDKKKAKRHIFLFSDFFILAKEKKDKGEEKNYNFKNLETFQDADVSDADSVVKFGFEFKTPATKYLFIANSAEEKAAWLKEIKALILKKKVFGVPLEDLIKKEKEEFGRTSLIPIIVEKIVTEITKRGLEIEGIFRLSGASTNINILRRQLDEGVATIDLSKEDALELAAILKQFFREFPEPLMTFKLYHRLIELQKSYENAADVSVYTHLLAVNELLSEIPKANQEILKYLVKFLLKVTEYSGVNKMGPQNISIVFGPNLLWPKEETITNTLNIPKVSSFLQFLVENHKFVLIDRKISEAEVQKGELDPSLVESATTLRRSKRSSEHGSEVSVPRLREKSFKQSGSSISSSSLTSSSSTSLEPTPSEDSMDDTSASVSPTSSSSAASLFHSASTSALSPLKKLSGLVKPTAREIQGAIPNLHKRTSIISKSKKLAQAESGELTDRERTTDTSGVSEASKSVSSSFIKCRPLRNSGVSIRFSDGGTFRAASTSASSASESGEQSPSMVRSSSNPGNWVETIVDPEIKKSRSNSELSSIISTLDIRDDFEKSRQLSPGKVTDSSEQSSSLSAISSAERSPTTSSEQVVQLSKSEAAHSSHGDDDSSNTTYENRTQKEPSSTDASNQPAKGTVESNPVDTQTSVPVVEKSPRTEPQIPTAVASSSTVDSSPITVDSPPTVVESSPLITETNTIVTSVAEQKDDPSQPLAEQSKDAENKQPEISTVPSEAPSGGS